MAAAHMVSPEIVSSMEMDCPVEVREEMEEDT